MNKIIIICLALILASCSPQRRLARLLERHPLPETHDTLYLPGETIYKDTTITRYLPGETVVFDLLVDVPIDIPDTFLIAETTLATALAHLKDNRLGLELIQKDSVFKFLLEKAIRENRDTVRIETVKEVPKLIPPNPFWKNGFWVVGGLLVLMILLLILRK